VPKKPSQAMLLTMGFALTPACWGQCPWVSLYAHAYTMLATSTSICMSQFSNNIKTSHRNTTKSFEKNKKT